MSQQFKLLIAIRLPDDKSFALDVLDTEALTIVFDAPISISWRSLFACNCSHILAPKLAPSGGWDWNDPRLLGETCLHQKRENAIYNRPKGDPFLLIWLEKSTLMLVQLRPRTDSKLLFRVRFCAFIPFNSLSTQVCAQLNRDGSRFSAYHHVDVGRSVMVVLGAVCGVDLVVGIRGAASRRGLPTLVGRAPNHVAESNLLDRAVAAPYDDRTACTE
jgi:hypothetical protein